MEVIYTPPWQEIPTVVKLALEEDVDVIALSSLAGSHLPFCRKLKPLLEANALDDKLWMIGGNLPADAPAGTALTTGITVYDTQGKAVKITFTLTKAANRTVLDGSTTSGRRSCS